MVYGIIGLFVMVAVWGLVNMLKTFTGTNGAPTTIQTPGVLNVPGGVQYRADGLH
jgi:hypothetical protein